MNKLRLAVTSLALGTALYLGLIPIHSEGKSPTSLEAASDVHLSAAATQPLAGVLAEPQDDLGNQVQSWIDALALQQGFETWNKAQWNKYPLGPGTHGWIVLLKQGKEEVGYIVVSATPEGRWVLTEYGTGSSPLFSLNTLYRSLVQLELIPDSLDFFLFPASIPVLIERLYHSPLHAVWQITTAADGPNGILYLDAKTGEQLPLSAKHFNRLLPFKTDGLPASADSLQTPQAILLPSFDPFHNTYWTHGKPLDVIDFPQLRTALQANSSITYVADLYDRSVLAPFAVTGYTDWVGLNSPFIGLEQEGMRYVPVRELFENGFFFP